VRLLFYDLLKENAFVSFGRKKVLYIVFHFRYLISHISDAFSCTVLKFVTLLRLFATTAYVLLQAAKGEALAKFSEISYSSKKRWYCNN